MKPWNKIAAALAVSTTVMLAPQAAAADSAQPSYTGTQEISLKKNGHYYTGAELAGTGAEIVSYDAGSKKAFLVNGYAKAIEILDMAGGDIRLVRQTVISSVYAGFDDVTSVVAHPTQDFIAAAVPAAKPDRGYVVFFTKDGDYLGHVPAGYHPDMITVTPDGGKLLVANEGEPNPTYSEDPPGSVTIIDVADGVQSVLADPFSKVSDIDFSALTKDDIDENVRIFPRGKNVPEGWKTDFEPEYIAVSPDSRTAYVTLQENNAIASLDLVSKAFTRVHGLGYKDFSIPGNGFDASDKDNKINIQPWPVLGAYMPDGMSLYQSGGRTYLVTANEGDARADWNEDGVYEEEVRVKDIAAKIKLDANKLQGFTQDELDRMKTDGTFTDDKKLGRLKVSNAVYSVSGADFYDALYGFGARSFSIWDADNIEAGPVFDSGDAFEQITARLLPDYFNSDHESVKFDSRSAGKGPEPEDVKIGRVGGETYAFVGLERMSGIVVYNVTNPEDARFVTYVNHRDFAEKDFSKNELGPEGLQFIPAEASPNGKPMLLVANEVSGTLAAYEIEISGAYAVNPAEDDAVYTTGTNDSGIRTMTVNQGVEGLRTFAVKATAEEAHYGKETVVFKQVRGGAQIGLAAVRTDFDLSDMEVQASFNVAAGDVIEIFVVDELTNDPAKLPILLQK